MLYRFATIKADETFTADTTEVIDMTLVDPISQLVLRFQPKTGAALASTAHFMKCISKIELVDGSDVLFSLSGVEAHALDWYSHLMERTNIIWYLGTTAQDLVLHISFGRYLYDPQLALDPTKFNNLQLKITLDIDGGGFNNSEIALSVFAHIFDEKTVTPEGFLMSKELKDYALGAGTHEYTDLPTDHPFRKLFLRIQKYGTGVEYCFDEIKLSEDNDKKVPLNHKIAEIIHAITAQQRPYREWIIGWGTTSATYFHCTPAYWPAISGSPWRSATLTTGLVFYEGDGGRFKTAQAAAGPNWQALIEGWCPHGVIEIPFGLQNEMEDWYDTTKLGSLQLDLKSASGMSSSETCQVFIQQLRKYA
ncbi:hypothetical protein LCGC14_0811740 [marine sediment metagenome]|uniref:Uncharacterized protein n=1 Tax=marine sediment metagenome TaxID=412755 RepID=A0A0F9S6F5_9ZZZZ